MLSLIINACGDVSRGPRVCGKAHGCRPRCSACAAATTVVAGVVTAAGHRDVSAIVIRMPSYVPREQTCRPRSKCLIPGFDGALFSQKWKDALWDRFFTAAPQRQRRSVEQYRIVKRAGGRWPSATGPTSLSKGSELVSFPIELSCAFADGRHDVNWARNFHGDFIVFPP